MIKHNDHIYIYKLIR